MPADALAPYVARTSAAMYWPGKIGKSFPSTREEFNKFCFSVEIYDVNTYILVYIYIFQNNSAKNELKIKVWREKERCDKKLNQSI